MSCVAAGDGSRVAAAAISIMSRNVHTLMYPVAAAGASSGHAVVHGHHDCLSDVAIHDVCLVDVRCGVLMMLGLVDGTCSVFSFPDQPASSSSASSMSSSSSSTAASGCPILLRRVAVGYLPSCSNQSTCACSDISFCCVPLRLTSHVARHTSHQLRTCRHAASVPLLPPRKLPPPHKVSLPPSPSTPALSPPHAHAH
jgi:hypothetical protein